MQSTPTCSVNVILKWKFINIPAGIFVIDKQAVQSYIYLRVNGFTVWKEGADKYDISYSQRNSNVRIIMLVTVSSVQTICQWWLFSPAVRFSAASVNIINSMCQQNRKILWGLISWVCVPAFESLDVNTVGLYFHTSAALKVCCYLKAFRILLNKESSRCLPSREFWSRGNDGRHHICK